MERHPYAPFIRWAQQYRTAGFYRDNGASRSAQAWIYSCGVVAARIDRYLELGHPAAQTLPGSLVLDILELEQSPYSGFPTGDPRRALIDTWRGLAQVYGMARTPGDREFHRLELLTDWAEVLQTPPGADFPGRSLMLARFHDEYRRLDLSQLRKEDHDFKYVGLLVQLLKLYRPLLPTTGTGTAPALRMAPGKPAAPGSSAVRTRPRGKAAVAAGAGTRHGSPVSQADPRRPVKGQQIDAGHALFGNWSDHWGNTLPGRK